MRKIVGLTFKAVLWMLGLVLLLFVGGIVAGFLVAKGALTKDEAMLAIFTPFAAAMMLGAVTYSVQYMRSIDEAAREAHKAAWFWGGLSGMAVGGIGMILSSAFQVDDWLTSLNLVDGPTDYMALGGFILMLLMCAGYTLVWLWWWFDRNRA